MIKNLIPIIFLFFFISCENIGDSYSWTKELSLNYFRKFGSVGYDYGWGIAHSQYDNGSILVGLKESSIGSNRDIWAIKVNELGQAEWDYTYGGNLNEEGYDVISTSDGGFMIAGYTWSYGSEQQIYIVKIDYYGIVEWEKTYGGSVWDVGYSILELKNGDFGIIGFSNSPGISSGNTDIILLRIDKYGNKIWLKAFGNKVYPNHEWGYDFLELQDESLILVGSRDRYDSEKNNNLIIRTDKNGVQLWEKEIITQDNIDEKAFSIVEDDLGAIFICSSINSSINREIYMPKIIKMDRFGNIEWQRKYNSNSRSYHQFDIAKSINDNILIIGSSLSNSSLGEKSDVFLTEIDKKGNIIKTNSFGSLDEDDWGWSGYQKSNGQIMIVGSTKSLNASLFDILLISLVSE